MKKTRTAYGIALLLTCNLTAPLEAQTLYVADVDRGTVGAYGPDGSTINASLISGLRNPPGIALWGDNLFVSTQNPGTIGQYTTSGAVVNPSLISGLNMPLCVAIWG